MPETGTVAGSKNIPPVDDSFGAKAKPQEPDVDEAKESDNSSEKPVDYKWDSSAQEHLDRNQRMQEKLEKERAIFEEEIDRIHNHPGMPEEQKARLPEREARLEEIDDALSQLARQRTRLRGEPAVASAPSDSSTKDEPSDVSQEYLDKKAKFEREVKESDQRLKRDLAEISYRHVETDRQALQDKIDNLAILERGERAVLDTEMLELREHRLLPALLELEEAFAQMDNLSPEDKDLYDRIKKERNTINIVVTERKTWNLHGEAIERCAKIEKLLTTDISDIRNRAKGMFSGPTELSVEEIDSIQTLLEKAREIKGKIATERTDALTAKDRQESVQGLLDQMKVVEQEAELLKHNVGSRLQKEQSRSKLESIGGWVNEKAHAISSTYNKIPLKVRTGISVGLMAATWWGPGLLGAVGGAAYTVNALEVIDKVQLSMRIAGAFAVYVGLEGVMKNAQEKEMGEDNVSLGRVLFRRIASGAIAGFAGSGVLFEPAKVIVHSVGDVAGTVMDWWHATGVALPPVEAATVVTHVTEGTDLVRAGSGLGGGAVAGVAESHPAMAATGITSSVAETHAETAVSSAGSMTSTGAEAVTTSASAENVTSAGASTVSTEATNVTTPAVEVPPASAGTPSITPKVEDFETPQPAVPAEPIAPVAPEALGVVSPEVIAKHATEGGDQVWVDLRKDVVEYARAHNLPVPSPKGVNNVIGNILAQDDPSKIDAEHLKGWLARGVDNFDHNLEPRPEDIGVDMHGASPEVEVPSAPAPETNVPVDHPSAPETPDVTETPAPAPEATPATPEVTPPPASFTSSGAMLEDLAKSGAKHFHELPSDILMKPVGEQVQYLMNRDLSWLDQKGVFGSVTKWNETALWMDMKSAAAEKMMQGKSLAPETSPFNVMARYLKELGKQVPIAKGEQVLPYLERAIKTLVERK